MPRHVRVRCPSLATQLFKQAGGTEQRPACLLRRRQRWRQRVRPHAIHVLRGVLMRMRLPALRRLHGGAGGGRGAGHGRHKATLQPITFLNVCHERDRSRSPGRCTPIMWECGCSHRLLRLARRRSALRVGGRPCQRRPSLNTAVQACGGWRLNAGHPLGADHLCDGLWGAV